MSERYVIPSIERAIRVLDVLAEEHRPMSQADLARALEIPKSTLFRILVTLQKHHVVTTDADGRYYRLGSHLWELGNRFADQSDLFRTAQSFMEGLADECGETVFLSKLEDGEVVYLRRMESPKSVTVVKKLESRVPAHCTATGLALLAYLPRTEVERILDEHPMESFNDATITDRPTLLRRLDDVRAKAFAVVDGEYNRELLCVAAPVFDHSRRPCASLTVAMVAAQIEAPERVEQVGGAVRRAADNLSRALGGRTTAR